MFILCFLLVGFGPLFLYHISMKQKFFDLIKNSELLKKYSLIDIALIAMELHRLGIVKEEFVDVSRLSE